MPEVLFTSSGGSIDLSDGTNFKEIWELSYNRIEVPVNIGYKFLKILRIQAGVVPGFMLKADARNGDLKEEVTDNYKNASWAFQAGLGLDFWLLSADLKYQGAFTSVHNENITVPGTEVKMSPDTRLNMWVLSIGIRIF